MSEAPATYSYTVTQAALAAAELSAGDLTDGVSLELLTIRVLARRALRPGQPPAALHQALTRVAHIAEQAMDRLLVEAA